MVATGVIATQVASADDAFEFHGYARWGTVYEKDGKDEGNRNNLGIAADGQTGNAVGRLGNEGSGGEVLLLKKFEGDNGTKWDLGYMMEDWGDGGPNTKQFYAGASNVFASQPDAYIWAGKVFHSRLQQGLNDYFVSIADGQGAGVKGLNLGFANLELGFVDSGSGHDFAATSKLSDIKFSEDVRLDIIANRGFTDNSVEDGIDAYLLLAHLKANVVDGWNQNFYARYSNNVENSLSWGKFEGLTSVYLSTDGSISLNDSTAIEYLFGMQDFKYDLVAQEAAEADSEEEVEVPQDRVALSAIIRPTHAWNDIHSTWLELGYSTVDFDSEQDNNKAFKATLSQNIAIGGMPWSRPMLRFYVSTGEEENGGNKQSLTGFGLMFEAWW